jgi:filamin
VNRKDAGYAELDVTVTSPLGRHLPIEVKGMPDGDGELIEFVPTVPGKYKIAITYGGVEVPNSPITFNAQEGLSPKVDGSGLYHGIVNEPTNFTIDATNIYGVPEVRVDGPDSEATATIEKENELFHVTYVPLEIGVFDVRVLWNGRDVPGL